MRLSEITKMLSDAGIENARGEARTLLSRYGGISPAQMIGRDPECDKSELIDAVTRRIAREPLQYIIGEAAFYNEVYRVTPAVLIPRQDTEILVEYAVKNLPRGARFFDLCTGSGCIAVSVLCNTELTSAVAADLSSDALGVARENAELNGVNDRIEFKKCDLLSERIDGRVYAVLSNPPYVTEAAYRELEAEIYHEPRAAFVGGEDGLIFYRKIISDYKDAIDDCGFFAFEIGYDQAQALIKLGAEHGMNTEIIKDYAGNDRVAILKKQSLTQSGTPS